MVGGDMRKGDACRCFMRRSEQHAGLRKDSAYAIATTLS
jgi:hypothetical protein